MREEREQQPAVSVDLIQRIQLPNYPCSEQRGNTAAGPFRRLVIACRVTATLLRAADRSCSRCREYVGTTLHGTFVFPIGQFEALSYLGENWQSARGVMKDYQRL